MAKVNFKRTSDENYRFGFRVATVPEPSTAVLAIFGCALMLWWNSRASSPLSFFFTLSFSLRRRRQPLPRLPLKGHANDLLSDEPPTRSYRPGRADPRAGVALAGPSGTTRQASATVSYNDTSPAEMALARARLSTTTPVTAGQAIPAPCPGAGPVFTSVPQFDPILGTLTSVETSVPPRSKHFMTRRIIPS